MRRTDPEFELIIVESKIKDLEKALDALRRKQERLRALIRRQRRSKYHPGITYERRPRYGVTYTNPIGER